VPCYSLKAAGIKIFFEIPVILPSLFLCKAKDVPKDAAEFLDGKIQKLQMFYNGMQYFSKKAGILCLLCMQKMYG